MEERRKKIIKGIFEESIWMLITFVASFSVIKFLGTSYYPESEIKEVTYPAIAILGVFLSALNFLIKGSIGYFKPDKFEMEN